MKKRTERRTSTVTQRPLEVFSMRENITACPISGNITLPILPQPLQPKRHEIGRHSILRIQVKD